jgi:hypothetical protein
VRVMCTLGIRDVCVMFRLGILEVCVMCRLGTLEVCVSNLTVYHLFLGFGRLNETQNASF